MGPTGPFANFWNLWRTFAAAKNRAPMRLFLTSKSRGLKSYSRYKNSIEAFSDAFHRLRCYITSYSRGPHQARIVLHIRPALYFSASGTTRYFSSIWLLVVWLCLIIIELQKSKCQHNKLECMMSPRPLGLWLGPPMTMLRNCYYFQ